MRSRQAGRSERRLTQANFQASFDRSMRGEAVMGMGDVGTRAERRSYVIELVRQTRKEDEVP